MALEKTTARKQRLAAALKENLKRRKAKRASTSVPHRAPRADFETTPAGGPKSASKHH